MATLCELLREEAGWFESRTALLIRRGYRIERWSYRSLWDSSERLATYLRDHGLRHGDRVLLWAPNMPEWVALYFGCLRTGVVVVPLDVRSGTDFVARVNEKVSARWLFVSRDARLPVPELGIPVHNLEDLAGDLQSTVIDPSIPMPAENDIAEVMFTSGTTGEPKGVILTHRNIASNVLAAVRVMRVKPNSRVISLLPLSHMFEQTVGLLGMLRLGATVVYPFSRQPAIIFKTLREQQITNIVLVPQVLQLFWNALEREVKKQGKERQWGKLLRLAAHLPLVGRRLLFRPVHAKLGGKLDFFVCGGAYLDPDLARRWELLGIPIIQGYGTTEAAPIVTASSLAERKLDALGRVLPGQELRIAPDGEVQTRGANVTPGYWQDPGATAAAFEGEWYRTGDLGYLDKEGFLHFQGRKKDMIALPSGMKVYAQDVEEVLKSFPAVADCCVLGVPGEGSDIQVRAVLLLKDGQLKAGEIVAQANKRLADHQRICGTTLWPFADFPRTSTLKIKKHEVLDYLLQGTLKDDRTRSPAGRETAEAPALYRLLAEVARVPVKDIQPDLTLGDDLNLDSLGRVELLAAIEAETGIYLDESKVPADITVKELEALTAAGQAPADQGYVEWPLRKPAVLFRAISQWLVVFPLLRLAASLTVAGREHLTSLPGPVLFTANHQSHMDTAVLLAALPGSLRRRIAVAAAADFWFTGGSVKGTMASLLFNAFPFSRTDSIRPTLERCSRLLDGGWPVLVFPEGTRSVTGCMAAFKSGAGLMAVELGVPVVPVYVRGTYEILPKDRVLPRRGPVQVSFGKALRFAPHTPYSEATAAIENAVREAGGETTNEHE